MSPVHLRNLGIPRNQPEDREGLSRARRLRGGHLGHSVGWQNTDGNNTPSAIHFPIQQKPQTRGLERYRSSSSAPPTPQRSFQMEHGQQEVQPSIPLGRTLSKLPEDIFQRDTLQRPYGNHQRLENHRQRTAEPDGAYSYSFRLTRSRPNQLSSGFTPFKHQQIHGQESPFFTIPGSFQEKTRIQGKNQDICQPKAERVRLNDPEAVGLGERGTQEPEIVVNTPIISSPTNRNITPTQTEHNVGTTESNPSSDKLQLKMYQLSVQNQKKLYYFKRLNERFQRNAILQKTTIKATQESCAQLIKATEEIKKRLNQLFEEKHHCKRDRDCMDQEINKLFDVYQNMKPQQQGHPLDDPYHQEDLKPDALLGNRARTPSQYQDGDNMSYSEKEALKSLPEASSWPKFSDTGEYDHMKPIDYIDRLFIDVPRIPDYWITARLKRAFKGHASIWYTEMKEIHGRRSWSWWM
ncbi:hypothetical protein O181_090740 [Austropuccinia psidii MF-1]|uniref:Uncharacterized protein n=1 Tax=Austropuccinia psidii MF-1 TaxID=1389203 RepID=A0A9Q3IVK4_9BASI|nr:hypothetical protein [Austropuccinia psidii MF-1]